MATDTDHVFTVGVNNRFLTKVEKYIGYMDKIDFVTKTGWPSFD